MSEPKEFQGVARSELVRLVVRHQDLRQQAEAQCERAQREREVFRKQLQYMLDVEGQRTLEAAVAKWGESSQIDMAIEECAELIVALQHHRRGRITFEACAEEIADVWIMVRQLEIIMEDDSVAEAKLAKIERLKSRLQSKG